MYDYCYKKSLPTKLTFCIKNVWFAMIQFNKYIKILDGKKKEERVKFRRDQEEMKKVERLEAIRWILIDNIQIFIFYEVKKDRKDKVLERWK